AASARSEMAALDSDRRLAPALSAEEVRTGGGLIGGLKNLAFLAIPIIMLLVLWELVARLSGMPAALFPPASAIFSALVRMAAQGTLWLDIWASFSRLIQSIVLGSLVGTLIGVLMGYYRIWERILAPPLNFLLAIPGTALFPLSMIWFGLTEFAITSILIYEVALTVILNTWTGVRTVDGSLIRAGKAFGATGPSLFWRVLIPAALPSMIAGYRLAFSRCWRIL